jgi:hypothetical protein
MLAASHFGLGIVTWKMPYLFRTPPGVNLYVRGPSNFFKDGASPLDGIVETDWSEATFTMNWKLTRPDHSVVFEEGEPICMLVPQPRFFLESFSPEIRDISSDLNLQAAHEEWSNERSVFEWARRESKIASHEWQRHYYAGLTVNGLSATEHQRKLTLRPFAPVPQSSDTDLIEDTER